MGVYKIALRGFCGGRFMTVRCHRIMKIMLELDNYSGCQVADPELPQEPLHS
jgi:hypothetical protein